MIWLLYVLIDSVVNWYFIEKKNTVPDYGKLFVIRGGAAILYGGLIMDVQYTLGYFLSWIIITVFTFPFPFNVSLNTFRKRELEYCGAESGWIDEFVAKHHLQRVWFWVTFVMFLAGFKLMTLYHLA